MLIPGHLLLYKHLIALFCCFILCCDSNFKLFLLPELNLTNSVCATAIVGTILFPCRWILYSRHRGFEPLRFVYFICYKYLPVKVFFLSLSRIGRSTKEDFFLCYNFYHILYIYFLKIK